MGKKGINQERGQSLVLTALLMIVFMGILMLAIDGGMAFSKRRAAQNAADAGALAGVRTLCIKKDVPQAYADATAYAENFNEAVGSNVSIVNRTVTVTTTIPFSTTFAQFFGFNQVTAQAVAKAGCFSPTYGEGVLPVAWSCRAPVIGFSDSTQCDQQRITWNELAAYEALSPPHICNPGTTEICPELYVVMDSESYQNDFYCLEDDPVNGTLTCDLDGDGTVDWLAAGGRSWLDLDGNDTAYDCEQSSEGASELIYWIEHGFENPSNPSDPRCKLDIHTWVPESTGVATSIFINVEHRRQTNPLVVLPVFDDYCPDGDPRVAATCAGKWHPNASDLNLDKLNPMTAAQPAYFHIKYFSAFYITCVRLNNGDICPGAERLEAVNGNMPNLKSIEGYFLEGYISGIGGKGDPNIDTGLYTFYLMQ